jgi:hypothetical protein
LVARDERRDRISQGGSGMGAVPKADRHWHITLPVSVLRL